MPLIGDEQIRFLEGPNSIIVGTHDGKSIPTCSRALALRCQPDGLRVTVWLPAGVANRAVQNLAAEPRIAVAVNRPSTHETWQLKGRVLSVRPAADDQRPALTAAFEAFIQECGQVGTPRRLLERVVLWPAVEVTLEACEVFHQTPGPGAGDRFAGTA